MTKEEKKLVKSISEDLIILAINYSNKIDYLYSRGVSCLDSEVKNYRARLTHIMKVLSCACSHDEINQLIDTHIKGVGK